MSRQSNFFQRVIAAIERQLAQEGVQVTESALLPEPTSGAEREVDVHIAGELNGYPVAIAVECRDWKTPQDVDWIDALIGKYRDMGMALVVAVSTSGFTKAAETKAKSVRIRTVHFAPNNEDPTISQLSLILLRQSSRLASCEFKLDPPLDNPQALQWQQVLDALVAEQNGSNERSFGEILKILFHGQVQDAVREEITQRVEEIISTGENVTLDIWVPIQVTNQYLQVPDGKRHTIEVIKYRAIVSVETVHAAAKSYTYNHRTVVIGTADLGVPGSIAVTAVQAHDTGPFKLAHVEVSSASSLLFRGHRNAATK